MVSSKTFKAFIKLLKSNACGRNSIFGDENHTNAFDFIFRRFFNTKKSHSIETLGIWSVQSQKGINFSICVILVDYYKI